jgi:pimeloyl-ACP methyl ester carboxylesterase
VLLDSDLDESAESAELAAFAAEEEAALDAGDVAAAVEANVRMWVTRGDRDVDPSVVDLVSAMQRDAFEAQMGVDAELDEPDPPVASRLGEIGVPALVIVGADDLEDFVRRGERLAGALPGAGPLVRIAGAAHLPALERPDEVAAAVVPFLRARCASP